MRRLIPYIIAIMSILSCERRPLEESFEERAKIPVSIDWSKTELDPATDTENLYRASVYLFANSGTPFDGASYKEYKLSNATYDEIMVPMGEYSVVIFNNSTSEFSGNVDFRGKDGYDDFEYYIKDDTRAQNYKLEPDILGAWRIEKFTVTKEMVLGNQGFRPVTKAVEGFDQLMNVTPERLTYTVHVKVYAKNIKSAVSASGNLIGMAHSVKMASGEKSYDGANFGFSFDSKNYDDGSTKDGYIEATFETIGLLFDKDERYYLEVRFKLSEEYDGSLYFPAEDEKPFRYDVTDQVEKYRDELHIYIIIKPDEGGGEGGGDDDKEIILPELNISGGFQPNIDDWGEEEDLII